MAIYFFDKNQTLIKIVPESATFEAIQTQELDDDSLLKDTLSVTVKGDEKLIDAEYMAVKSYKGNAQTFDMYRIVTDTTPDKSMSFTGMSLAPYELNGHILQDLRPANHSLSYTLNRVLDGTDWRVGYIDDGLSNVTTTFYYVSAKEALKELQSLVGCEFVFKVEISGQKITDKWIEVYSEMGNRTKKRFNYGTNALTVVRETNKADIFTALIGRGKGEEVSSADDNASGQAGYGRNITFEDIEWKKSSGKPLDKPKGQYYLELPQATQAYGIKNIDGTMKARVGIVDFDDEEDKNRLINLTYQQLLVSSRPKVLFKTTVANIGATGIGDTVTIHRHDLNIHYQTRVRKIVRNKLNDNKTQIELGDAVVTASTKQTKQNNATIKNLNNEIDKIKANVTTSQNSADGKNTIFYGSAEPERQRTGDTWYRPHPSIAGETQMLTWNGTAWELVIDTSDLTSVSREVKDAIDKAENAKALAISEADSALTKAKADATAKANAIKEKITGEVNTAISTAEDAKALAVSESSRALTNANKYADEQDALIKQQVTNSVDAAISKAEDAKQTAETSYSNAVAEAERLTEEQSEAFNKKFEKNATEMSNVSKSAKDADAKAQSALTKAGANANLLTTHQNTLNTIKNTTLPDINKSLSDAIGDAQSALSSASSAMDEAKKADGKIADYVTKKGLVNGTTVDSKIDTATGEISKKITTLETNKLDGTTYTDFYNNEYKQTAKGVTDTWEAVNKIVDENGNTTNTFAQAVYEKNATKQSADFKKVTDGLVKEATYTAGINGVSGKITTVEGKIDGLQVGGTNYAFNTGLILSQTSKNVRVRTEVNFEALKGLEGQEITYSFEAKSTEPGNGSVYILDLRNYQTLGRHVDHKNIGAIGTNWKKFEVTAKVNSDITLNSKSEFTLAHDSSSSHTVQVRNLKIEKGNVATDWSPAPEDMQSVAGLDSNITAIYNNTSSETAKAINKTLTAYTPKKELDKEVTNLLTNTNSQTAKKINSTLTAIEGKIPTEIGGRNLIKQSNMSKFASSGTFDSATNTWNLTAQSGASSWGSGISITGKDVIIPNGSWYTISFEIYTPVALNWNVDVNTYPVSGTAWKGNDNDLAAKRFTSSKALEANKWTKCWIKVSATHPNATGDIYDNTNFGLVNNTGSPVSFKIRNVKGELGDVVTDWSPAPEDMATAIKTNEIERTADYSKMAITNLSKNGVVESSSVNATKDGITERVAKVDANGKISYSNRNVKLNSIVTTIADQKYISQQVQGSNIIQNTIATIAPAGANLFKNSDFREVVTGARFNGGGNSAYSHNTYPAGWGGYNGGITNPKNKWHAFLNNKSLNFPVVEFNETGGNRNWKAITTRLDNNKYAKINPNANYMFSVDTWAKTTGAKLFGGFYYTKKGGTSQAFHAGQFNIPVTKAGEWERLSAKAPLGSDVDLSKPVTFNIYGYGFATNTLLYIKNVSLTEGDITAGWSLSPEDTATQSQVTQLQDSWSMKLKKADDVVTQINATSAGVLIQGKNIQLDGNVTMTSYFQVPNANIKDLAVNKITGTNAQFTTMITKGLTANVITSNMIKADDAMFTKLFATSLATDKLVAQDAWIKSANIVSLDASKITAGTIATARLDSKKIVTAGLTANVVKSTHIESSTGLIDKIFANDALITRLTSNSIFASKIKAIEIDASKITSGELESARIKSVDVVTDGLTADAIQATHIKAETGLVDKIFSKTAYIEELTNKSIFTEKIQAININADKITTGTLDAGKVKVVNLDANNITANKTSFIQSNWNAVNAFTQIDASGIQMLGSGTWRRTFLSPTGFRMFNGQGAGNKAGAIGYFKSSTDLEGLANPLKEDFMWQNQQRHTVGIGVNGSHLLSLGFQNPGAKSQDGYNPAITIDPQASGRITNSTYTEFRAEARFHDSLSFSGKDNFRMYNGLYLNTDYFTIKAETGVRIFRGDDQKILFGGNVQLHTNIDMNGNTISNQSDERLKKNIETLRSNDFEKLMSVRMISYEWKDPNKQQGTHIGFSAQELQKVYPELILEGEDGYLGIDSNGLAMAHMNAFKQHASQTNDEISKLKAQIASLQDELALLKGD